MCSAVLLFHHGITLYINKSLYSSCIWSCPTKWNCSTYTATIGRITAVNVFKQYYGVNQLILLLDGDEAWDLLYWCRCTEGPQDGASVLWNADASVTFSSTWSHIFSDNPCGIMWYQPNAKCTVSVWACMCSHRCFGFWWSVLKLCVHKWIMDWLGMDASHGLCLCWYCTVNKLTFVPIAHSTPNPARYLSKVSSVLI